MVDRLAAPLSNARRTSNTKRVIKRKDFSALLKHATWADGLTGATPMRGTPNSKALPVPSGTKPSECSPRSPTDAPLRATVSASRGGVEDIIAREILINDEVDDFADADSQNIQAMVADYMVHEAFMMSAPRQSYITRCSSMVVTPRAVLEPLVMAVDTDSSLQLATADLLHNVRKCGGKKIKTLAGYVDTQSIGDLVIPHRVVGSIIVEATVVAKDILPGGTRVKA